MLNVIRLTVFSFDGRLIIWDSDSDSKAIEVISNLGSLNQCMDIGE
jgi:hypothetical protein